MDWFLYDNGHRHEKVNELRYNILNATDCITWIYIHQNTT